jgi:hypothetical protein
MVIRFPINPVLESLSYANDNLTLVFKKKIEGKVLLQSRQYENVPKEVVYPWIYKKSASEVLSYYAKNIRKKFKLISIK